jgi:hypothetical protein
MLMQTVRENDKLQEKRQMSGLAVTCRTAN